MAANLDLARAAYDLLVNRFPQGLTRTDLATKLKCDDRSARDAVNTCRVLAAQLPHPVTKKVWIVGFDPSTKLYCAARDAATARKIIAYQESRIIDISRALSAQKEAFQSSFGMSYVTSEQEGIAF